MKNAVIYARFSSVGQNEQTIDGQIRVCREYAERQGYNVIRIYDGDKAKSASKETEKRKDLHRMFEDAKSGIFQCIIVYAMDRFARNRTESRIFKTELQKNGVKVLSATEQISDDEGGELYEMFLEWNAEKYSQRLSKRVLVGLDTSVANGTYAGGQLLYGYNLVGTGRKGSRGEINTLEINEEQADVVRFIFEQYDKGTEKKDIAIELNKQGHKFRGKPFYARTFDKWLLNAKYTGEFLFGGRFCDNIFPQIIDKALFQRVQMRLKENQYFSGSNSAKEQYLLTGKAFCGHCGTPIVADGGTSKTGVTYHYYACKRTKKSLCDKMRDKKDLLEYLVVSRVVKYLKDGVFVNKVANDIIRHYDTRTSNDTFKSLDTRIANVRQDIEELTTSYIGAKNALLKESIEKRMNENEILLKDLTLQKAQLELEKGFRITKEQIIAFAEELVAYIDEHNKDHQKKIIDNVVEKVYIYDDRLVVYFNFNVGNDIESVSLEETNEAVSEAMSCSNLNTPCPPQDLLPS
ncbi:MAG: recombinase family protein [Firmicutes bacterium]|nr:recombinase family protein [Bacillota bacterium]